MAAVSGNRPTESLPARAIGQAMLFLKHWRLATVLFLLALTSGLCYYVYAKPVYRAKSLVKFTILKIGDEFLGIPRFQRYLHRSSPGIEMKGCRVNIRQVEDPGAVLRVSSPASDILPEFNFAVIVPRCGETVTVNFIPDLHF